MAGLWYRTGSVAVTQSSKKITGTGTSWLTALNRPSKGNVFYGPDGKAYEIDYISSETELYLVDAYAGAAATGQSYKIDVRGGTVPELSRQLSEHYAYMQGIIDSLQSIVSGTGDVTISGPSGQKVTLPSLSNMLSKSGNLAGLAAPDTALGNLGLTAVGKAVAKSADAAAGRTALGLGEAARLGVGISDGAAVTRVVGGGAGANVTYKRLATTPIGTSTSGDGLVEFILSGGANIAGVTYPTYLVQFSSRRTAYRIRAFAIASQAGAVNPPSFFVYQNTTSGNYELWCSVGPYIPNSLYIQPLVAFGGAVVDSATNAAAIPTGATDVTATAIHNLWSDKSLVKQTDLFDTTSGSMMQVGAFGLGSGAKNLASFITDAPQTTTGSFFRALAATAGGPGVDVSGICMPFDGAPSQTFLAAAVGSGRLFAGRRGSSGGTPTWEELWTKSGLPFETGTFTPVVKGSTSDGSCTYTAIFGKYTRIGDCVEFDIRVTWTGHTGTGNPMIAGLPFVPKANGQSALAPVNFVTSNPAVAVPTAYMWIAGGGSAHTIFGVTATGSNGGITSLPAAGSMLISGRYFI